MRELGWEGDLLLDHFSNYIELIDRSSYIFLDGFLIVWYALKQIVSSHSNYEGSRVNFKLKKTQKMVFSWMFNMNRSLPPRTYTNVSWFFRINWQLSDSMRLILTAALAFLSTSHSIQFKMKFRTTTRKKCYWNCVCFFIWLEIWV